MNKLLKRLKTKLSKSKGFTLTELLFSIIILMLSTSLIIQCFNLGIANVIRETRASEAQLLCSALTASIQNELTYAKDIKLSTDKTKLDTYFSSSRRMGANSEIIVDNGEIKIRLKDSSDEKDKYPIVASSNYKAKNRAGVGGNSDEDKYFLKAYLYNNGIQWDGEVFHVILWVDDASNNWSTTDDTAPAAAKEKALAYSEFSVKPLAGQVTIASSTP